MDWRHFWNNIPAQYEDTDFFRHVGKTVGGQPISEEQMSSIVRQIQECLSLGPEDIVLDLCCGNGLITNQIAKLCRRIAGVDYSGHLINIARTYHCPANAAYYLASVTEITPDIFPADERFSKIYMYEALQHLDEKDLAIMMERLRQLAIDGCPIFLGSVPDMAHIWDFYNTPERKEDYLRRKVEGREAIGTWWERKTLETIARDAGFNCVFIEQPQVLHSAHYRFDVLLEPAGLPLFAGGNR